jgi:hypothetical protein
MMIGTLDPDPGGVRLMARTRQLDGPARKKLDGLVAALNQNNAPLAVSRAQTLFGMITEDGTFANLPSDAHRAKLRRYWDERPGTETGRQKAAKATAGAAR